MILVFKTSVKTLKDVKALSNQLNGISPSIDWSFDLEDIDKVLRIECTNDITSKIINLLKYKGFKCQDLDTKIQYI